MITALAIVGALTVAGASITALSVLASWATEPRSKPVRTRIPRAWLNGIANGDAGRRSS